MKLPHNLRNRRPARVDESRTGVGFVDVLFAVVIGKILDLSVRDPGPIPAAGKAQLVLAALVAISSWVGYHNSLNRTRYFLRPFWNLPFWQFALDVLMVYTYWLLAVFAELSPTTHRYDALPEAALVASAFLLYAVWDIVALRIRRSDLYSERPASMDVPARRVVSFVGFFVAIAIAIVTGLVRPTHARGVIGLDVTLAILVVLYRLTKEWVTSPDNQVAAGDDEHQ